MSTSMLREFANQWLTERYGMDFALPNAGNGLSSLMQSSPTKRGSTPLPSPALGSTSSPLDGNTEDDDDPAEAANSIADILYHLFGDDALSHLDEVLPMMQYARDWDESKITRHPKGKREGGRFAAKHDAASLQDMHNNIASSLKGQKSPDSAKALASHLGNLTISQLHDLKKQYGISASGRTKQDLVSKIADRLDRGRRTPDEQMPPEEQQQPEQPPEESALPEMPPAGPQAPTGPPIPAPLQKATQRRKAMLEKHLGPQEEPFQLKAEPAPRPAPAVKLTNPNTKQQSLFDAGQGDLPGQQTLFDDIGTQGQPEPATPPTANTPSQPAPAPQNQADPASPETVPQPSAPAPQVPQAAAAAQPDTSPQTNMSADKIAKLRKSAGGDPNSAMTKAAKNTLKNTFGIDYDKETAEAAKAAAAKPAPAGMTPGADPALNGPEAKRMDDMVRKNQDFIRGVAQSAAKSRGLTYEDGEDLAGKIMDALFESAPTFQGGEDELRAFASTIAKRRGTDELRKGNAAGRDKRRTASLDTPIGDDGETMAGSVMDRASSGGRDNRMFDALHKHISHLPDNLRSFAELMMQGMSNREAAKNLGLSHTTGSVRAQQIAEYLTPYMHAEQYRRKNPRLFGIVESEIDRYFREHTLVDPQVERYFLFGGKSGMLGMLLRGALTAALFSLVNGMQGGGQQAQAAQPKPTPQP